MTRSSIFIANSCKCPCPDVAYNNEAVFIVLKEYQVSLSWIFKSDGSFITPPAPIRVDYVVLMGWFPSRR